MANTLTDLVPDMYEALDVVSREMTGFIAGANRDSNVERAALNQNVRVPITGAEAAADNTPAVNAPDTGDNTVDNVNVTISKSRHVPVRFNGEETLGLRNAGTYQTILGARFEQAMRTLVNEIEADLWGWAYKAASRAYGTAGTTPFGTANNLTDFSGTLRILEENGAPLGDLQLALGHSAMGNLRGIQSSLFKVNEAGREDMLRNGMTDRIMKFAIRNSNAVGVHTKGTGTAYDVNNGSGEAVGQTTITLDGGTAGATGIVAGDIVTFAGDTNKYVVKTGLAGASGDIVLTKPGLRLAATDATEMTIGNDFTANVAFARSAIVLATRAPALPANGDSATDRIAVTDALTGLSFEIAEYKQFRQTVYHVAIAWGGAAIKDEHISLLIG